MMRIVRFAIILGAFFAGARLAMSAPSQEVQSSARSFEVVEGEVLDVEEPANPREGAIYHVRDFRTGETIRFFAHSRRTVVSSGGETQSVTEVIAGAKGTFVYRKRTDPDPPELVYVKIIGSYLQES